MRMLVLSTYLEGYPQKKMTDFCKFVLEICLKMIEDFSIKIFLIFLGQLTADEFISICLDIFHWTSGLDLSQN